ncbi:MAG: peptidase [Acidobacteriia bacterium]|nr:peptidase [Terriglobia bacterium]
MRKVLYITVITLACLLASACSKPKSSGTTEEEKPKSPLEQEIDKFSPTEIGTPMLAFTPQERALISQLVAAADQIDQIYWRQVYPRNPKIQQRLQSSKDPNDLLTLRLFNLMYGPFDRLQENRPFYGQEAKPLGGGFYPPDMTKDEFQKWIQDHPKDKTDFESPYTVIQRQGKNLVAIPYSTAYKQWLEPAAQDLEAAAQQTSDKALQKFLRSRAKAFLTNDYYQSDLDWVDLSGNKIDVTIGPYEVYEDGLLNLKASFEAFIGVRDEESSKALDVYTSYIDNLENNLPEDDKYKNPHRGTLSPLVVVNELYDAGEARPGVQTAAFTLPNDERVRAKKGTKKIMLKNVTQAKFNKTLAPAAIRLIVDDQLQNVKFDPFFNHILLHELSHALGPGFITVGKEKTTVNRALKEQYTAIEEAKADVVGLYDAEFLAQKKVFDPAHLADYYISNVASIFRSVRFGADDAHGKANLLQFNFFMKEGALSYDETKQKFRTDVPKMKEATRKLANILLTIEAQGDYAAAKALMDEQGKMTPRLQSALRRLNDVPVDIAPQFTSVKK